MKMLIDTEHLTKPSGQMKIKVSRRGIFHRTADAAEKERRSRDGLPSYRIEDLAAYDPERLEEVKPLVNPKAKISLDEGVVYASTSAAVDPIPLFEVGSPALFVFNQFNGMQTMSEIFVKVSEFTGWNEEKTKDIVESIFLRLCEVRVCEPGNPV